MPLWSIWIRAALGLHAITCSWGEVCIFMGVFILTQEVKLIHIKRLASCPCHAVIEVQKRERRGNIAKVAAIREIAKEEVLE